MIQSEDLTLEVEIEVRGWDRVCKVVDVITLEEYVKRIDDVCCLERACIPFNLKEDLFHAALCALHEQGRLSGDCALQAFSQRLVDLCMSTKINNCIA